MVQKTSEETAIVGKYFSFPFNIAETNDAKLKKIIIRKSDPYS